MPNFLPYLGDLSPYLARRNAMYPPSMAQMHKNLVLKMGNPPNKRRPVTYRMMNPYTVITRAGRFGVTQPQLDLMKHPGFKKFKAISKGWVVRKQLKATHGLRKRMRDYRVKSKAYKYSGKGKIKAGFGIRKGTYKPRR